MSYRVKVKVRDIAEKSVSWNIQADHVWRSADKYLLWIIHKVPRFSLTLQGLKQCPRSGLKGNYGST